MHTRTLSILILTSLLGAALFGVPVVAQEPAEGAYWQIRNFEWGDDPEPEGLVDRALIQGPLDEPTVLNFYPQGWQLPDLERFEFEARVDGGGCPSSDPRVGIQLTVDGANGDPMVTYPWFSGECPDNGWERSGELTMRTYANHYTATGTLQQIHAAVSITDPDYTIRRLDINYDSTPASGVLSLDNVFINDFTLHTDDCLGPAATCFDVAIDTGDTAETDLNDNAALHIEFPDGQFIGGLSEDYEHAVTVPADGNDFRFWMYASDPTWDPLLQDKSSVMQLAQATHWAIEIYDLSSVNGYTEAPEDIPREALDEVWRCDSSGIDSNDDAICDEVAATGRIPFSALTGIQNRGASDPIPDAVMVWGFMDLAREGQPGLLGTDSVSGYYSFTEAVTQGHMINDALAYHATPVLFEFPADADGDGVRDDLDNCPSEPNEDQANFDGDMDGDACDDDDDNDGLTDEQEAAGQDASGGSHGYGATDPKDADSDDDGLEDGYEVNRDPPSNPNSEDTDGDEVNDDDDNCPNVVNPDQTNTDVSADGGDACDDDDDNDGLSDEQEAAGQDANGQPHGFGATDPLDNDSDGDNLSDGDELASDPRTDPNTADTDEDGTNDDTDNCPVTSNALQINSDGADDGGDACDDDDDNDTVPDVEDNCPTDANRDQLDTDGDGDGDACDDDDDNDTVLDVDDNCPTSFGASADQTNSDNDAMGDVCDPDDDNDGVNDVDEEGEPLDNCRTIKNPEQGDVDGDGIGDACEADADDDGIDTLDGNGDPLDNCPLTPNPRQSDLDRDGQGDACDDDIDGDDVDNVDDRYPFDRRRW